MLTGAAAFLILLIALLAIPVTLTFQAYWPQTSKSYLKLQWAFGLVSMQLPSAQSETSSTEGDDLIQKIERFEPSSHKNRNSFALIRQQSFRRRIIRFIRNFWRAIHKNELIVRFRIGLGDPADTGQLWAFVGPVSGMLANIKEAAIVIEPDFFDTTFELDSSGNIRFIPLQIIYLTVGMLLSPSIWLGIKKMHNME